MPSPNIQNHKARIIQNLFFIVMALAAFAIVIVSTKKYGAYLSPDSVNYISAARNLVAGKGVVTFTGSLLTLFPPLYPMLLGFISFVTGQDPLTFVHIVNGIFFALIVFLASILLKRYIVNSPYLLFLGAIAVLLSRPLVSVSVMALSEPFFICCVLLFFLAAHWYQKKGTPGALALLILFTALAPLIRYIGIVLVPVGALIILFQSGFPVKRKILHLLVFLFISLLPYCLWITRNYILAGNFMGDRHRTVVTPLLWIKIAVINLLSWVVSRGKLLPLSILSVMALVYPFISGFVFLIRKLKAHHWKAVAVFIIKNPLFMFLVFYLLFLFVSGITTAIDYPDSRLLSPIYIPMVILIFALLDRSIKYLEDTRFARKAMPLVLICVAVGLTSPAARIAADSYYRLRNGAGGYNTVSWRTSPTLDFFLHFTINKDDRVYSNCDDAIYILANRNAQRSPRKTFYNSPEIANKLSDLKGKWPEGGKGILVWFKSRDSKRLFTPDELAAIANLDTIGVFPDGIVFSVTAKE